LTTILGEYLELSEDKNTERYQQLLADFEKRKKVNINFCNSNFKKYWGKGRVANWAPPPPLLHLQCDHCYGIMIIFCNDRLVLLWYQQMMLKLKPD
jgi:predicted adenine nucleotide alpha hydrolase (AANH) superfamily ATPase